MVHRPRRIAAHATALGALATATLLFGGGPARADARPASFGGESTATGFHAVFDSTPGLTPVADLFHIDAPYADAEFDSTGGADAGAASLYPGAGPLGVPALICILANGCPATPPDYPLYAEASYPTQQDAKATASADPQNAGPAYLAPSVVAAHADTDTVRADAQAASAGVTGVLDVDAVHVSTTQGFERATLVVRSTSVLKGIDIGGAVHIDQLRSVSIAKVDGGKLSTGDATTTLSGVTVQGQGATIDEHGIHIADKGDGGQALAAANDALKQLAASGISARLLPPDQKVRPGHVAAATSGLLVSFKHTVSDVPGLPPCVDPNIPCGVSVDRDYFGTISLGGAGVVANADNTADSLDFSSFDTLGGAIAPPASTGAAPASGGTGSASLPSTSGTGTTPAATGGAPQLATGGQHVAASPRSALVADLVSRRVKLLALLLLGYPVATLLGSRLRLPFRLPTTR